jgi:hypothetical protein
MINTSWPIKKETARRRVVPLWILAALADIGVFLSDRRDVCVWPQR